MSAVNSRLPMEDDADAFLAEPFDLDDLESFVRHWLAASPPAGNGRPLRQGEGDANDRPAGAGYAAL